MDKQSEEDNDTDDETVKTYSKNKTRNSVFSQSILSASSESSQSPSVNEDNSSDSDVDIWDRRESRNILAFRWASLPIRATSSGAQVTKSAVKGGTPQLMASKLPISCQDVQASLDEVLSAAYNNHPWNYNFWFILWVRLSALHLPFIDVNATKI